LEIGVVIFAIILSLAKLSILLQIKGNWVFKNVEMMHISQFLATKDIQLTRIPAIFAIETSKEG